MNNRKQKVNSFLDSVTEKELEEYIKEHKLINKGYKELLNKVKDSKPKSHYMKLIEKNSENMNTAISNYINLGRAWVIAFVLECFYDNKYKVKDLQCYLKVLMDNDKTLKEYVYECMKDF
jgi:hypothetical protein